MGALPELQSFRQGVRMGAQERQTAGFGQAHQVARPLTLILCYICRAMHRSAAQRSAPLRLAIVRRSRLNRHLTVPAPGMTALGRTSQHRFASPRCAPPRSTQQCDPEPSKVSLSPPMPSLPIHDQDRTHTAPVPETNGTGANIAAMRCLASPRYATRRHAVLRAATRCSAIAVGPRLRPSTPFTT